MFLCDAYGTVPSDPVLALEQEVRRLRLRLWSSPEDKVEITEEIEALEAVLRHEIEVRRQ
jgi:hypothetical protein